MDTIINAALLGILEGLTEFLPVSSTGHLILAGDLLGFEGPPGHVFEIVIQLAAILAVAWVYRARLWAVACHLHRPGPEQRLALYVALSFAPAMVLGALFHGVIKSVLFSPASVAVALILGGIAILLIERYKPAPRIASIESMGWKTALAIGLFQAVAMIPGVSRAGATIMGALLMRLDRKAATEYSFFLAIPTMCAAALYDSYKNAEAFRSLEHLSTIAVGFAAAFISALLVIRWFLAFVARHDFRPFAWYRIALGLLMLGLLA